MTHIGEFQNSTSNLLYCNLTKWITLSRIKLVKTYNIIPLGRERNDKPDNEKVVAKIHTYLLPVLNIVLCSEQD